MSSITRALANSGLFETDTFSDQAVTGDERS
jgi:hypothetical protein